ncbi:MAG: Histidine kinase, partial [Marmoricola sp.]|nr:Histidine kinase [Marmoricola sp.]
AESRALQRMAEQETARAYRESEQALEIARLREGQAQLAHDVHDVVGHSLAVILAQAESAQYLDQADTEALRLSMQNIASSARSSLRDVRQVLTPAQASAAGLGTLTDLVDGVRGSGHEVLLAKKGTERPLAPELATVAYRVLQEMLTNAIRHGSRDEPLRVGLTWGDELRIEVANLIGAETTGDVFGGQGVEGMRRRLESVGGELTLGQFAGTFTATAHLPLRTVYP